MTDLPEPPDDDDDEDLDEEWSVEELVGSLLDDFALLEDDDLIQIVPVLDTIVMPPDDLPSVSGTALVWASEQVLGPAEEDEDEREAEYQAALAQGRADAAATGCPSEQVEVMGFALSTYPRILEQVAETECHLTMTNKRPPAEDSYERLEENKVQRTFTAMRQGLVAICVTMGRTLNRSDESISADVIDARRKGQANAAKIVQMAIARTRGEL
jgi:hypothetical protein